MAPLYSSCRTINLRLICVPERLGNFLPEAQFWSFRSHLSPALVHPARTPVASPPHSQVFSRRSEQKRSHVCNVSSTGTDPALSRWSKWRRTASKWARHGVFVLDRSYFYAVPLPVWLMHVRHKAGPKAPIPTYCGPRYCSRIGVGTVILP